MRIQTAVLSALCVTAVAASAAAAWAPGTIRNQTGMPDVPCKGTANVARCPFMSDGAHFGGDNSTVYLDFYQNSTWASVTTSACRQSWTGSAYVCASGAETTSTGWQDVSITGFSGTGSASAWDYFFVLVDCTSNDGGACTVPDGGPWFSFILGMSFI